ncbi:MAG: hypothetical protein WAN12_10960 [Candidatus Acidiferrum sp.]
MSRFFPLLVILAYAICSSSARAQTKSPLIPPCKGEVKYSVTDGGPYNELIHESDPNRRLALLDDFVSQHKPSPAMLVYIYPLYSRSYSEVKNFPMVIEYTDKLLALGDKVGASERYAALREWAAAYNSMDSVDATLAEKALMRTGEGIEAVGKIDKPESVDANTFELQKRIATIYFHATAGAAAIKLKNFPAAHDSFKAIVALEDAPLPCVQQKSVNK